jgi:hypothetical protein
MGASFCFFTFTSLGFVGTSGSVGSGSGFTGGAGSGGSGGVAALISEISISSLDGCLILTGFTLGGFIAFRAVRSSTARALAFANCSFFKSLIVYARLRLVVTASVTALIGSASTGLNSRAISDIGISLKVIFFF